MNNIIEMIAGQSLVIDDIEKDYVDSTPFPLGCTCTAEVFDENKHLIGVEIDGTRADETKPFVVVCNKNTTSIWDGLLTIVVTVSFPDGVIAAKDKFYVKAEKF